MQFGHGFEAIDSVEAILAIRTMESMGGLENRLDALPLIATDIHKDLHAHVP
jgi:hypothetical protein